MAKLKLSPIAVITKLTVAGVVALAGLFGYQLLRADLAAEVYRDRLEGLASEYEALRGTFNEVVAQTAVTELLVEDEALRVRIRNAAGELATLETPFDPNDEIHVDYVIVDGRLLIRRIYDDQTPPAEAMLIDPSLASIDWDAVGTRHGTTIYRALDEGRWVISVSANGSLDLARIGPSEPIELAEQPPVREYDEIRGEAKTAIDGIGPVDVFGRLLFGERGEASPAAQLPAQSPAQ
ncbi:MAG: hypothetical protein AAGB48_05480 [Planctomycetota bacterium]